MKFTVTELSVHAADLLSTVSTGDYLGSSPRKVRKNVSQLDDTSCGCQYVSTRSSWSLVFPRKLGCVLRIRRVRRYANGRRLGQIKDTNAFWQQMLLKINTNLAVPVDQGRLGTRISVVWKTGTWIILQRDAEMSTYWPWGWVCMRQNCCYGLRRHFVTRTAKCPPRTSCGDSKGKCSDRTPGAYR